MEQVIIRCTESRQIYFALNHNRRRSGLVAEHCSTENEVVMKIAAEFRRIYPASTTCDRQRHNILHAEYYKRHCHAFVMKEGQDTRGGFVVLSGELMGLHHLDPGHGDFLMHHALKAGADRLDCFDVPHLIALFTKHGFVEVLREANTTPGKPDVVFMRKQA